MSRVRILLMLSALVSVLSYIYVTMPAPQSRKTPRGLTGRIRGVHFPRLPGRVKDTSGSQPCPPQQDCQTGLPGSCDSSPTLPAPGQNEYPQPPEGKTRSSATSPPATIAPTTPAWNDHTAQPLRLARRCRLPRGGDKASESADLAERDCPYFLWRRIQIQDDDTLLIDLRLCTNPAESSTGGAIVGQVIPEGWEVTSTSPAVNARDSQKREIKWLFTTIAPGTEQHLKIILQPLTTGETTVLAEDSTFYRCRRPSGQTAQFSCLDL